MDQFNHTPLANGYVRPQIVGSSIGIHKWKAMNAFKSRETMLAGARPPWKSVQPIMQWSSRWMIQIAWFRSICI